MEYFVNPSLFFFQTKEQMIWLRKAILNEEKESAIKRNFSLLTCSALTYEQRFSIYGEIMT